MDCGMEAMNSASKEFSQVPVLVLCGGRGVMFDERQHERSNKALISIRGKPLVWWVMGHYALHGARDFVLATGLHSERFSDALTAAGARREGEILCVTLGDQHCRIRLAPTPVEATTAARLHACRPLLGNAERFALTYSDTLSDVDLSAEMRFHRQQQIAATLLGTRYPVRFRILGIRQGEFRVRAFAPRPVIESTLINGGYYIFTQEVWSPAYGLASAVALENEPLERLAAAGQLAAFEHKGSWQHCDSERDLAELERLARQLEERLAASA